MRLLAAMLMLSVASCARPQARVAAVSGRVTLDSEPVVGAAVMFVPQGGGRPASGVTDRDGVYRLTTFRSDDGALLGPHRVTVTKSEIGGAHADEHGLSGGVDRGGITTRWVVPRHYSDPEQSKLTANVVPGLNQCDFELRTDSQ